MRACLVCFSSLKCRRSPRHLAAVLLVRSRHHRRPQHQPHQQHLSSAVSLCKSRALLLSLRCTTLRVLQQAACQEGTFFLNKKDSTYRGCLFRSATLSPPHEAPRSSLSIQVSFYYPRLVQTAETRGTCRSSSTAPSSSAHAAPRYRPRNPAARSRGKTGGRYCCARPSRSASSGSPTS